MGKQKIFSDLERILEERYKRFGGTLYCEYSGLDYFVVNCPTSLYKFVPKSYYKWVVSFIKAYLTKHNIKGYFYFIEYAIKL